MRPFDVHMLDEDAWHSDLKMLGIDITAVPPVSTFDSVLSPKLLAPESYFCA